MQSGRHFPFAAPSGAPSACFSFTGRSRRPAAKLDARVPSGCYVRLPKMGARNEIGKD